MSKTVKRILITGLLAITVLATALFIGGSAKDRVIADNLPVTLSEQLKESYVMGETVNIPKATIKYNGQDLAADKHKVVSPDGQVYGRAEISLSVSGIYTVYYYKTVEAGLISGNVSFSVLNKAFSVGSDSTITYGTSDKLASGAQGLNVSLAEGNTFNCNLPLNLNGKTSADKIFSFIPLPTKEGTANANEFYLKLTDAYDKNNYVIIKTLHSDISYDVSFRYGRSYQSVSTATQPYIGLQVTGGNGVTYEGKNYILNKGGNTGYMSICSLSMVEGYNNDKAMYGSNEMSFAMDYENKKVYGSARLNSSADNLIADLDSPLMAESLWEGFTTGEVYLSAWAEGYSTTKFNFLVTGVLGEDLTQVDIASEKKPIIEVDKEEGAYAIVGTPFNVFKARGLDIYEGILDCNVKVYYNSRISVPVEKGAFTPKREGKHTVVYSVTNKYGKSSEVVVNVQAYAKSQTELSVGLLPSITSGSAALIPVPTVLNASGSYTVDIVAKHKSNAQVSYTLELTENGYTFTPLYSGAYDLVYTVSDYTTKKEFVSAITVTAGSYSLKNEPSLPKYFIKNAEYAIAGVGGYKLDTGAPEEKPVSIKYSLDNGALKDVGENKIKIEASSSVRMEYYCDGNKVYEKSVPVVDVNYGTKEIAISKYFALDGFTENTSYAAFEYTAYTASASERGASMSFIKEISANNFSLAFKASVPEKDGEGKDIDKPTCNFDVMTFTLEGENERLEIKLENRSSALSVITVNGKQEFAISSSIRDGASYVIGYRNSTRTVYLNTHTFALSEEAFAGFTKSNAYFSLSIDEVEKESTIRIEKLNNQNISGKATNDISAPEIYREVDTSTANIGDKITLKNIGAIDVLSVNSVCTVTVKGTDKKAIKDDNGLLLNNVPASGEYTFTLSNYGIYSVEITAKDDAGKTSKETVSIMVEDVVAPVITVDTAEITGNVNENLTVKEYSVTDNVDGAENIKVNVMIIDCDGVSHSYTGEYKPPMAGRYVVVIYAVDANNNQTQAHYTVVVG